MIKVADDELTDAEAWAVLGATLAGAGYVETGLCLVLLRAQQEGLISNSQRYRMGYQLVLFGRKIHKKIGSYYWSEGAVQPRARACAALALLVEYEAL